jgi:NADP-dependent 3-hydroxy acid dehydrogenase YdfG
LIASWYEILGAGGTAVVVPGDLTNAADAQHLVEATIAAFGKIDVLVNSVGTNIPRRALGELTGESWQMMVNVNLNAAFHLTQAVLPVFRRQASGLIIHISSVAAKKPDRSGVAYQATKAAVAALAHGTMEEERDNGIRTTVIYPGMTDTPLLDRRPVPPSPEARQRALQPDDVADACLFVMALPPRVHVAEIVLSPSRA